MNELLATTNDAAWAPDLVQVVAWTLLHFFWQGALVAAALAGCLALLRSRSSHLRYGVACAALAVMAAMPLATGWWLAASEQGPGAGMADAGRARAESTAAPARWSADGVAARGTAAEPAAATPGRERGSHRLDVALPWLVRLWLAGVAALSLVHLGGWLRVRRLRSRGVRRVAAQWRHLCGSLARRLGIRRPVELLESTRVAVPTAIGWLKPLVLLPASSFTGLTPRQLESILAHELAHVRRHDYLVNVLQVAMETLLFYHPAVWWASRQVRELREHCCDDLAVAVCGDRMIYARALADLEELRFASPVFALGADGGSLLERIRRLAGAPPAVGAARSGWMVPALAAAALVATATVLAFAGRPSLAQEEAAVHDPAEIGIPSFPLVPPVIVAQVTEDEGGSGETPAAEASGEAPGTLRGAAIPLDELIEMKIHGLDGLLDEVEGTAYADLPTRELLEMARFGVDRELIAELDAAGYRDLRASELVELAKFGVDGELIAELEAAGYAGLGSAELVELAKFGVDGELIAELAESGYRGLASADLVELAKFGVDGDHIQEMRAAGYVVASIAELVELAKFGVDGELIAELAESGYRSLPSADLVELAKFGVDGELIAELAGSGYRELATGDLVELAKFGVDGDFIRDLRDAGVENLSVDDLIRMARHGIDAEFLAKMKDRGRI